MLFLKRFILMIQFFTTIPIPITIKSDNKDFGKGLSLAPIIGLLMGLYLVVVYFVFKLIFPPIVVAIIILIAYVIISGGLHLDGLADSFDGLFSNRSRERMLEIMRDSRVGTNGVIVLVLVLLSNFILINWLISSELTFQTILKIILLLPISGKIGSLIGAGVSNYARVGEGLGKSFIDFCGAREIAIGNAFAVIVFIICFGVNGFILSLSSMLSAVILTKFFTRKIGGATGDILGAVCELNQFIFLVLMVFLQYKNIII